jgi:predicted phage terminase large subunit-like protein
MSFALQMQNEIVPYAGIVFQREWFRNRFDYAPPPEEIRHVFATWDTAGTLTGRSYTVGLVIVITKDWDYHVLHQFRGRVEYPDLKRVIRETAKRWRVSATVIEAKATGQPVLQELAQENLRVIPVLPPGQRGGPAHFEWVEQVTIPCEEGRVWLPSSDFLRRHNVEDWTDTFIDEMLAYPDGSNDDIVVALTQLLFHVERERPQWDVEAAYRALPPMRYGLGSGEKAVAV